MKIFIKIKQKQKNFYRLTKYFVFALLIVICFDSFAHKYINKSNIIGEILTHRVSEDETFYDIARNYDLGIEELIYANPKIDPWLPGEGASVVIPSMHILPLAKCEGIIINKAELRLYYFSKASKTCNIEHVLTFPIGLGENGFDTPLGVAHVIKKQKNPFWIPPVSIKLEKPYLAEIIPPGDDNPLGNYAIYLSWPEILIHGTNKPWSVGTYSTHGCIRMYPEDIELLFKKVRVGTMVQVIDQPVKIGWFGDNLYIEVALTQEQRFQLDLFGKVIIVPNLDVIKRKIINQYKNVNENALDNALQGFQGIPIKIN